METKKTFTNQAPKYQYSPLPKTANKQTTRTKLYVVSSSEDYFWTLGCQSLRNRCVAS